MHPNITASFLKCFIIRIRKHKRRRRQKDFATEASAKGTVTKIDSGNLMPKRTMAQDYGVASNARNRTVSFFVPSVSFLVKSPYVIFSISSSRSPVMLRFKLLMFLSLYNNFARLSRMFTSQTSV